MTSTTRPLPDLTPCHFSYIDEAPDAPVFAGFWEPGENWNGWACPSFTKAEADRIMAAWNGASYDAKADAFSFPYDPSDLTREEPHDVFRGVDHPTHGRLYPVGARGWTWSAVAADGGPVHRPLQRRQDRPDASMTPPPCTTYQRLGDGDRCENRGGPCPSENGERCDCRSRGRSAR